MTCVSRGSSEKNLFVRRKMDKISLSYVVHLKGTTPEENEPFSRYARVHMDPYTSYWSSYYAKNVVINKENHYTWATRATNYRVTPVTSGRGVNLQVVRGVGDLDGDNKHEVVIGLLMDTQICVLFVSSHNDDFTDSFSYPSICYDTNAKFDVPFSVTTVFAYRKGAVTLLHFGAITNFESLTSFVAEIPFPLKPDSFPVKTFQEPVLVDFPPAFFLSRIFNIILAVLGCFLAWVLMFCLRKKHLLAKVR